MPRIKKASPASVRQRKELSRLSIKTIDYDQPRQDWPSEFDQSGRNIKEILYSCEHCCQPFNRYSKRETHQINCAQKPVFDSEDESRLKTTPEKPNRKKLLDNSSEDDNSEKEEENALCVFRGQRQSSSQKKSKVIDLESLDLESSSSDIVSASSDDSDIIFVTSYNEVKDSGIDLESIKFEKIPEKTSLQSDFGELNSADDNALESSTPKKQKIDFTKAYFENSEIKDLTYNGFIPEYTPETFPETFPETTSESNSTHTNDLQKITQEKLRYLKILTEPLLLDPDPVILCNFCKETFKTDYSLKKHKTFCSKFNLTTIPRPKIIVEPQPKNRNSEAINHTKMMFTIKWKYFTKMECRYEILYYDEQTEKNEKTENGEKTENDGYVSMSLGDKITGLKYSSIKKSTYENPIPVVYKKMNYLVYQLHMEKQGENKFRKFKFRLWLENDYIDSKVVDSFSNLTKNESDLKKGV